MVGADTGLPQQRATSAGVVQTRKNQRNNLLPLGTGTVDRRAEKRSTAINGRDLCGVTGAETGIMQRSGTLRHTAYWEGQSGHLPRL